MRIYVTILYIHQIYTFILNNIVLPYFIGELANAIRQKTNIKFGLHYCLFEWFNIANSLSHPGP